MYTFTIHYANGATHEFHGITKAIVYDNERREFTDELILKHDFSAISAASGNSICLKSATETISLTCQDLQVIHVQKD